MVHRVFCMLKVKRETKHNNNNKKCEEKPIDRARVISYIFYLYIFDSVENLFDGQICVFIRRSLFLSFSICAARSSFLLLFCSFDSKDSGCVHWCLYIVAATVARLCVNVCVCVLCVAMLFRSKCQIRFVSNITYVHNVYGILDV